MMLNNSLEQMIRGKNILVTGGTGSIGRALVHKILQYHPAVVRIYSRDETKQFELYQSLDNVKNVRFLIGDVRDRQRLGLALEDVHTVYHTAALKHLSACEYNPFEAVKTNVLGTQNLIDQCIDKGVKQVIGISTDKVVNPISILGTTKLLAEKLLIAGNGIKGRHQTIFSCVRFGNVAGARGSVIPLFLDQLRRKKSLTVTDPLASRFIMSSDEAVELILKAAALGIGGAVFILPMPSVRVIDVAEAMLERYETVYGEKITLEITGLRSGEKLHEDLVFAEESTKAFLLNDLIIIPSEFSNSIPGTLLSAQKTAKLVLNSGEQIPLSKPEILKLVQKVDVMNLLKWDDSK